MTRVTPGIPIFIEETQASESDMRSSCSLPALGILLGLLLCGSGCTAIGYGLGYASDASADHAKETRLDEALGYLSVGDSVRVSLRGGEVVHGLYAGTESASLDILTGAGDFGPVVPARQRTAVLPGDTLLMDRTGRPSARVIYVGAEPRRLLYADSSRNEVRPLLFDQITRLARMDGRVIERPYPDRVADGTFGRRTLLLVRVDGAVRHIDAAAIESVRYERVSTGGRLTGAMIGLVVDLAVIVALATAEWEMTWSSE